MADAKPAGDHKDDIEPEKCGVQPDPAVNKLDEIKSLHQEIQRLKDKNRRLELTLEITKKKVIQQEEHIMQLQNSVSEQHSSIIHSYIQNSQGPNTQSVNNQSGNILGSDGQQVSPRQPGVCDARPGQSGSLAVDSDCNAISEEARHNNSGEADLYCLEGSCGQGKPQSMEEYSTAYKNVVQQLEQTQKQLSEYKAAFGEIDLEGFNGYREYKRRCQEEKGRHPMGAHSHGNMSGSQFERFCAQLTLGASTLNLQNTSELIEGGLKNMNAEQLVILNTKLLVLLNKRRIEYFPDVKAQLDEVLVQLSDYEALKMRFGALEAKHKALQVKYDNFVKFHAQTARTRLK